MKFSQNRKFGTFCHIETDARFILIRMQWKSSIFYSNHFLSLFYKIRQFSKTKAVNIESPDITISICNNYITDRHGMSSKISRMILVKYTVKSV